MITIWIILLGKIQTLPNFVNKLPKTNWPGKQIVKKPGA